MARSRCTSLFYGDNKMTGFVYGGDYLSRPNKNNYNLYFNVDSRLITREIPFAHVRMEEELDDMHRSIRYLNWFIVRYYVEQQTLANFILNEEEYLQDLINKYDIGWYNIIHALSTMYNLSNIGRFVKDKVTKDTYLRAFEEFSEVAAANHRASYFIASNHEIALNKSIERYCEKVNKSVGSVYISESIEDTPSGILTEKETLDAKRRIEKYLKVVCT
jgi:hypothetical protein